MEDGHKTSPMHALKAAVEDLLNHRQLSVEDAMDRHFSPTFRQRTNGIWEDRAAVLQRIAQLRSTLRHATFTVRDALACGNRYAEQHTIALAMCDGSEVALQVYVFAERDGDGRFAWIEEAVHPVASPCATP